MLSVEDAVRLAEQWVDENPRIPPNCLISIGKYKGGNKQRRGFALYWRVKELNRSFNLIDFCVCDDGSVKVLKDHRKHIGKFSISGFEHEDRFFAAVGVRTPHTPRWFAGVRKADISTDISGIDGFVDIVKKTPKYEVRLEVPFQLKSSRTGRNHHFERRPDHRGKVIVLIVREDTPDETLRQQCYTAVGEMVAKNKRGELRLKKSPLAEAAE